MRDHLSHLSIDNTSKHRGTHSIYTLLSSIDLLVMLESLFKVALSWDKLLVIVSWSGALRGVRSEARQSKVAGQFLVRRVSSILQIPPGGGGGWLETKDNKTNAMFASNKFLAY